MPCLSIKFRNNLNCNIKSHKYFKVKNLNNERIIFHYFLYNKKNSILIENNHIRELEKNKM